MYHPRGNNAYGQGQQQPQQSYSRQSAFGQNLGSDGGDSQMSMSSRHSTMLGGHPSAGTHYGGQYTSMYGSVTLSSALQATDASAKGSGSSALEGRSAYVSSMQESPKYASGDRRQYVERPGVYSVRDSQNEPTTRFGDPIAFGHHQHQSDIYDRLDAASALRKELLQAQTLQSSSIEGSSRQADYLAARTATARHAGQELLPYGGRMDPDPNTLSMMSGLSHRGHHAPSILGAAPRRDVDDLLYPPSSAKPGYGVSLPPGRDYASGKGLHTTPLEADYPGGILARAGYARLDDRKDDRGHARELQRRDEERRRELLREREKERERERERERKRERERILERRGKKRERETKRVTEIRRERTPPRISRDRGGSLSTKVERSFRRESPRIEAPHRRRSPVKEKRREYVCKVYSSSLVDVERDYLSIDKRYPRLFTSPECSKVIVNWSKENLKIPLNVPVSFEHDFVQDDKETQQKEASIAKMVEDPVKSEHGSTRWNAKVILMSGLSRNALEELSSERDYEDRIPHFCNMLRFACLKNGNALMAIGGLWETVDGNDPSVDKSTLVQTALRYAKDLTGLDLKNCQHWNPFLEIHYDRVGKDGLFSHKEVTVLYIPDLSDCLPSVDAWRDQWLAHKKEFAELERLHALKREISQGKKEGLTDKEPGTTKDLKNDAKPEKKKASGSSVSASKLIEKAKGKVKESGKEGVQSNTVMEKKGVVEATGEGDNSEKINLTEVAPVQTTGSGKKKIIRKVVKKKVAEKDKDGKAAEQSDSLVPKKVGETTTNTEAAARDEEPSGNPSAVKTFTRKKVTKKVPAAKVVKKEDEGTQSVVTPVKEQESSENKPKKADTGSASGKTTVKKKIIKRVTKRKVVAKVVNNKDKVAEEVGITIGEQNSTLGIKDSEVKLESNELVSKTKAPSVVPEKKKNEGDLVINENKGDNDHGKEEKKGKVDSGSSSKMKSGNEQSKDGEKSKEVKDKKSKEVIKDNDGKAESKGKEVKDKKKDEEPPRHPGLILQTKESNDSKLRSLSLSLDSLLGYDDNDIEESTFELSLFAETIYEMLQYQMGSRILTFLQKLRIKFVAKRNEKKRQLEEISEKEKEKVKTPTKRVKTDNSTVESKSVETEVRVESLTKDEKTIAKDENMLAENVENRKPDGEEPEEDPEEDSEEDPEEYPEEDEDMTDAIPKDDTENEEKAAIEKDGIDVKSKNVEKKVKVEQVGDDKETVNPNVKLEDADKQEKEKVDVKKKENIDKEILQAFRFFDRNRVGHIRVEDMRLIIHNLGNFLSHKDVKELVQSALLESNSGRDDRILYNKLVRMSDI